MTQGEQGRAELEALRRMVVAWAEGYAAQAKTAEDEAFFGRELLLEVEEVVYPYLVRLEESGYIGVSDAAEFMRFCEGQARELAAPG
ncbi:MAG TPA: hypothetical protein VFA46_10915 [Actinomycetes bacterium]|jgi:hypothetical protein|nr:hypothetical protein [Actinomycetes bacterium]